MEVARAFRDFGVAFPRIIRDFGVAFCLKGLPRKCLSCATLRLQAISGFRVRVQRNNTEEREALEREREREKEVY